MSNEEIAELMLGALAIGDTSAAVERLHPDVVLDATRAPSEALRGVYRGVEEAERFWRRWIESWGGGSPEYHVAGDLVLVWVELIVPEFGFLLTFDSGRVVRINVHGDHRDALDAAGLLVPEDERPVPGQLLRAPADLPVSVLLEWSAASSAEPATLRAGAVIRVSSVDSGFEPAQYPPMLPLDHPDWIPQGPRAPMWFWAKPERLEDLEHDMSEEDLSVYRGEIVLSLRDYAEGRVRPA